MILEIITPEKKAFEGEVTSVKFPGIAGGFEILINEFKSVGRYSSIWDGSFHATGIYFIILYSDDTIIKQKIIIFLSTP